MRKKVLLYTERWSSGGIESLVTNIVKQLDKNKFSTQILVSQKETENFDRILKDSKCKIDEVLKNQYKNPIRRILKNLTLLEKKLKEYDVDVIHINLYNSVGLVYAWIAKKVGIKKIIVHAHNTGIDNDKFKIKFIIHSLCKKIFNNKKYTYVACSKEASKFCFGNVNSLIFQNGIDPEKYKFDSNIREEYRKKFKVENKLVVGNVARFVEQKNHKFLIDVFKCIEEINKNAILVLVGIGPLKQDIEQKIKEYNLEEKVIFLGERKDVNKLMQMMDVFCLPSIYEGLGIVLIEAQTSGMPCIVSKSIPNEAILTDKIKRIDLNDNAKVWAEKCIKLGISTKREDNTNIITKKGYNLKTNIEILQQEYLRS